MTWFKRTLPLCTVDVKLDDNGEIFATKLVAGMVASEVRSSGDTALSTSGECDVLAPVPGWWMFIKEEVPREHPRVIAQREMLKQIEEMRAMSGQGKSAGGLWGPFQGAT